MFLHKNQVPVTNASTYPAHLQAIVKHLQNAIENKKAQ